MTYQKLISEPLPKYSRGEEIFNLTTHIVGASFGIVVFILSLVLGFLETMTFKAFFALNLFSLTCIILYTISSVYHGLSPKRVSKRILRILDHCTIYLLIAGT